MWDRVHSTTECDFGTLPRVLSFQFGIPTVSNLEFLSDAPTRQIPVCRLHFLGRRMVVEPLEDDLRANTLVVTWFLAHELAIGLSFRRNRWQIDAMIPGPGGKLPIVLPSFTSCTEPLLDVRRRGSQMRSRQSMQFMEVHRLTELAQTGDLVEVPAF